METNQLQINSLAELNREIERRAAEAAAAKAQEERMRADEEASAKHALLECAKLHLPSFLHDQLEAKVCSSTSRNDFCELDGFVHIKHDDIFTLRLYLKDGKPAHHFRGGEWRERAQGCFEWGIPYKDEDADEHLAIFPRFESYNACDDFVTAWEKAREQKPRADEMRAALAKQPPPPKPEPFQAEHVLLEYFSYHNHSKIEPRLNELRKDGWRVTQMQVVPAYAERGLAHNGDEGWSHDVYFLLEKEAA